MTEPKIVNKSPQIGVRFRPDEMERLRQHAERNYAGNVSTLVKVAVKRLLDSDPERERPETATVAA